MKIYTITPRGFCSGVKRAIYIVEEALQTKKKPIYVLHEIVHNTHVIDEFKKKGVIFVESLDEIPLQATVVFSAHGVSSLTWVEAKKKKLDILDATCPTVKKLHMEVKSYLYKGYTIFVLGKKNHREVIEVKMENASKIFLIEAPSDIEQLPDLKNEPLIYFTQTTLPLEEIETLATCLQKKYPQIEKPSLATCFATIHRQKALKNILPLVEAVLVIGDEKSANSQRLKEIAELNQKKAKLILNADSLDKEWLASIESLAITAGASTPELLVQNCLKKIEESFPVQIEPFVLKNI